MENMVIPPIWARATQDQIKRKELSEQRVPFMQMPRALTVFGQRRSLYQNNLNGIRQETKRFETKKE